MKPLLLDTNVLIRFFRSDRKISDIISAYEKIVVPSVVLGEFKAGADPTKTCGQRQLEVLESFLDSPSVGVIPVTEDIASVYARIFRVLKANGTPIPQNDMWIAACAVDAGATLLSSDAHFASIPLLDMHIVE
jgi:predicted nucleic acid-binding protein